MTITKSKNLIYQTIAIMFTCLILLAFALEIDASIVVKPDSGLKIYNEAESAQGVVLEKPRSNVIISDPATSVKDEQIQKIIAEVKVLSPIKSISFQKSYEPSLDNLTSKYDIVRDRSGEMNIGHALMVLIYKDNSNWEAELKKQSLYDPMVYFVYYGTETTKHLGAGERAGVINSWKTSKQSNDLSIPKFAQDWEDIIKIANGRWPNVLPENDYIKAKEDTFRQVYLRNPDYSNAHDEAAIMTMSYGLRPQPRNVNSENEAIGFFKQIFDKDLVSASDWDIVRAIAYSGATR